MTGKTFYLNSIQQQISCYIIVTGKTSHLNYIQQQQIGCYSITDGKISHLNYINQYLDHRRTNITFFLSKQWQMRYIQPSLTIESLMVCHMGQTSEDYVDVFFVHYGDYGLKQGSCFWNWTTMRWAQWQAGITVLTDILLHSAKQRSNVKRRQGVHCFSKHRSSLQ